MRTGGEVLALLALALLPGCQNTINGHWRAVEVVPSRDVFYLDDATFSRDGTYSAATTRDGQRAHEAGRYRFTGFKLILQPQAGGRRAYSALLKLNRLEVIDGRRKVVLQRD